MTNRTRIIASVARRKLLGVAPAHDNPYATHLPTLATLATLRPIRTILELGSGMYSTPLFLDRRFFPELTKLTSFEDDPEWAAGVVAKYGDDPRLQLHTVDTVRENVPTAVDEFDLIFIDDSRLTSERQFTISSVGSQRPQRAVVVIHDYEQRHYRRASRAFQHRHVVGAYTPQVGICWNGSLLNRDQLRQATSMLEANSGLAPDDLDAWRRVISDETM